MTRKNIVSIELSDIASSTQLQQVLSDALEFPGWYGNNWNAFWDAITGLVDMPEQLQLIGWGLFVERFPFDARMMAECLDDMSKKLPATAARVEYI